MVSKHGLELPTTSFRRFRSRSLSSVTSGHSKGLPNCRSDLVSAIYKLLIVSLILWVSDAPVRLKRELDAVLTLQTELDAINGYFQHVQKAISEDTGNPEAFRFLETLRQAHEETVNKVEELYVSLNLTDEFPDIQGLPLAFIRTLLLARDLKINIRKRAIGSFFEWGKLDRAAGGGDEPLGSHLSSCNSHLY